MISFAVYLLFHAFIAIFVYPFLYKTLISLGTPVRWGYMKHWQMENGERRSQTRFKQAFQAVCEIGGRRYKARTFDINGKGMTLLTAAVLPRVMGYRVVCRLPEGPSASFEVNEVQRMALTRRGKRFFRLGLSMTHQNIETQQFLSRVARLFSELANPLMSHRHPTRIAPPLPIAMGRGQQRVVFQLPAFVHVENRMFRCHTHDLCSWGIGLSAPPDFPGVGIFELVCLEPSGEEVLILVQEKHRGPIKGPTRRQLLGLQVIGGQEHYTRILCQHLYAPTPMPSGAFQL